MKKIFLISIIFLMSCVGNDNQQQTLTPIPSTKISTISPTITTTPTSTVTATITPTSTPEPTATQNAGNPEIFFSRKDINGDIKLYLYNLTTRETSLLFDPQFNGFNNLYDIPEISGAPDQKYVVFTLMNRAGSFWTDFMLLDRENNDVNLIFSSKKTDFSFFRWTPDSSTLFFTEENSSDSISYKFNVIEDSVASIANEEDQLQLRFNSANKDRSLELTYLKLSGIIYSECQRYSNILDKSTHCRLVVPIGKTVKYLQLPDKSKYYNSYPQFSPDKHSFVAISNNYHFSNGRPLPDFTNQLHFQILSKLGSYYQVSPDEGRVWEYAWSPDSQQLYYLYQPQKESPFELYQYDIQKETNIKVLEDLITFGVNSSDNIYFLNKDNSAITDNNITATQVPEIGVCGKIGEVYNDPVNFELPGYLDIISVESSLENEKLSISFYFRELQQNILVNKKDSYTNSREYIWAVGIDTDKNVFTGSYFRGSNLIEPLGDGLEYILSLQHYKNSENQISGRIEEVMDTKFFQWNFPRFSVKEEPINLIINYVNNSITLESEILGITENSMLSFWDFETENELGEQVIMSDCNSN
jgi:hypothetical protein